MGNNFYKNAEFSDLTGKTIIKIEGAEVGSNEIRIFCSDGSIYLMLHLFEDDEEVYVENISGEIHSIINSPITMTEKVILMDCDMTEERKDLLERMKSMYVASSYTWIWFKLSTETSEVMIRWFATSDFYAEDVFFREILYDENAKSYPYFEV